MVKISSKINIYISPRETNVRLSNNTTELDVVLAIVALFDRLSIETKNMIIPKL